MFDLLWKTTNNEIIISLLSSLNKALFNKNMIFHNFIVSYIRSVPCLIFNFIC
jgi:hypothetical protein